MSVAFRAMPMELAPLKRKLRLERPESVPSTSTGAWSGSAR